MKLQTLPELPSSSLNLIATRTALGGCPKSHRASSIRSDSMVQMQGGSHEPSIFIYPRPTRM